MIRIGVIGYGYWGPNIVRNLHSTEGAQVVSLCDTRHERLKLAKKTYPAIEITTNPNELISSPDIDAVAIITPVFAHYELAKNALNNGKHVFVEKPFTSTVSQAEELIEIADKKKLITMVDHTFLFTGAVKKIKELIDNGTLGQLYYFDSVRVNLGLFQHDVNVIWDLAPHDLSIMDYLVEHKATAVVATGKSHFESGLEDIAYLTVFFPDKMIAHFNVNWMSPVKVRTTLIGGDKKMIVWNDLEPDEKIKVYDKGVKVKSTENVYNLLVSYRSGDAWVPKVDQIEALKLESEYFIDCITHNRAPINDGKSGLRVVRILEAANKSIKHRGKMVTL